MSTVIKEDDNAASPGSKRVCQIGTPECFRVGGEYHTSTPISKALNFAPPTLKIGDIPVPFMERFFLNSLDRMRLKNGIEEHLEKGVISCCSIDLKTKTVLVEVASQEIAMKLAALKTFKYLHHTLTIEEVVDKETRLMDDDFNDDNMLDMGVSPLLNNLYDVSTLQDSLHASEPAVNEMSVSNVALVNERKDCKMVITDIPPNSDMDFLEFSLTQFLKNHKVCFDNETCVVSCEKTSPTTATVEFYKKKFVDFLVSLAFPFMGTILTLHPYVDKNVHSLENKNSCKVVFLELPPKSDMSFLQFRVHKILVGDGICSQNETSILSCEERGPTSAVIEFVEQKFAEHLLSLGNVPFMGCVLVLSPFSESNVNEVADINPCKVVVSQLPPNYDMNFLEFVVFKILKQHGLCTQNGTCIQSSIKSGPTSAVIELYDQKFAELLLSIGNIPFMGCELVLSPFSETNVNAIVDINPCKVTMYELPPNYDTDFLEFSICKILVEHGVCSQNDICILSCEKTGPTSAMIEFCEEKIAAHMVFIRNMPFMGNSVLIQPYAVDSACISEDAVSTPLADAEPKPSQYRTDWPYYESAEFLKLCIKNREILLNPRQGTYKSTWTSIEECMQGKGMLYEEETLKKRLRGIVKYFRTGAASEDWCLKGLVQEYLGIIPVGSALVPNLCKQQSEPTVCRPNNRKHCGVVVMDNFDLNDDFTHASYVKDLFLISEYKSRKPRFDDAVTRASTLYAEISEACQRKGYREMTAEKCCNRMAALASTFREKYDLIRYQTGIGADPTSWPYYHEFQELYHDSPIIEPQKLVSMGSVHQITTRLSNQPQQYHGRKNAKAQTQKTTPPSQKERKVLVGEGLLEEFKKMNAMLSSKK